MADRWADRWTDGSMGWTDRWMGGRLHGGMEGQLMVPSMSPTNTGAGCFRAYELQAGASGSGMSLQDGGARAKNRFLQSCTFLFRSLICCYTSVYLDIDPPPCARALSISMAAHRGSEFANVLYTRTAQHSNHSHAAQRGHTAYNCRCGSIFHSTVLPVRLLLSVGLPVYSPVSPWHPISLSVRIWHSISARPSVVEYPRQHSRVRAKHAF